MKKQALNISQILLLIGAFAVYSCESIFVKFASAHQLFSPLFLLFYGMAIVVLAVYAVLWQIVLKSTPLNIAFNCKSVTVVFILIIAHFLFGETITIQNVLGSLCILGGIILLPLKQ